MSYEKKFDIETFIKKAQVFNKDKERADKLKHKEGYLKHLCSNFEDTLFFSAVYSELFPEDNSTIELLRKIISNMFETEDIIFLNLKTLSDVDELYKRFKIRAKSALKRLQMHEIEMIERVKKRTQEAERLEKIKRIKEIEKPSQQGSIEYIQKLPEKKYNVEKNITTNPVSMRSRHNNFRNPIDLSKMLDVSTKVPFGAVPKPQNKPNNQHKRKRIGKEFDELSHELKSELLHDRERRKEVEKKMPEMVKNIKIRESIKAAEMRKQPALQRQEVRTFSK